MPWRQTPSARDEDHQVATEAVIRACSLANALGVKTAHPARRWPAISFFEAGVPYTEFEEFRPDTYLDITAVFDQKLKAMQALESQPLLAEWYTGYALQRAHRARTFSGNQNIQYSEAFARYRPMVPEFLP